MSLESTIADLAAASREQTSVVAGKMTEIDKSVAAAVKAIPELHKNIYLSNDGNDDNDGSQSTPLKTIQSACNRVPRGGSATIYLRSGDEYYVREIAGDWWQFVNIDSKTIFITSYGNGASPVIKMKLSVWTSVNGYQYHVAAGFATNGGGFLIVEGCDIETPKLPVGSNGPASFIIGGLFSIESGGASETTPYGGGELPLGLVRCNIRINDYQLASFNGLSKLFLDTVAFSFDGNQAKAFIQKGSHGVNIVSAKDIEIPEGMAITDMFSKFTASNTLSNLSFP